MSSLVNKPLASMVVAALVASVGVAPGSALAQSPERCSKDSEGDDDSKQTKFHIEYINGKPVTVVDTVIDVCGKVPRPSVAYISVPKNINYEWEGLKQDFMPLILSTVKKAPF
jgi:hypothetical protein